METVFLLYHEYLREGKWVEVKFCGFFMSPAHAQIGIIRLRDKPGFRWHREGFKIYECWLDKDWWEDGFENPDPNDPPSDMHNYEERGFLVGALKYFVNEFQSPPVGG